MATGPVSKIMELQLEQTVVDARAAGKALDGIVVLCNQDLARRGVEQTVSKSTLKRYLARLAPGTVAAAHEPTAARANAHVAIAFAERLNRLDQLLGMWLEEAVDAQQPVTVGSGDSATVEMVPDWRARGIMAREMRGLLGTYTDLMQRVHDAEEVKAFQESVLDAIREADPNVAAAVIAKLRERQSIRKAAILGA
jgi:hypothetical protein